MRGEQNHVENSGVGRRYYPISLNIKGRKCVVIGGGQVALRKVEVLLGHDADVEVISPELCLELLGLAETNRIQAIKREYKTGDLKNAFIAIVATDDSENNHRIAGEARKNSVLVNIVDDAEFSDFIAPSFIRQGDITIAISTSGVSPALARKIRTLLENKFGEEYAQLAELISRVRAQAKQQDIRVSGDDWQEAIDLEVLLGLLREGKEKEAGTILLDNLKARQQ